MATAAVRLPTKAQLAKVGPTTMIPAFLLVKNRVPLSPDKQARLDERLRRHNDGDAARVDYRKPKGMSWEDWDTYQEAEAARKRAASYKRIEELRASGIIPPKSEKRGPAGEAYKGHRAGSRLAIMHRAFDEGGLDEAFRVGRELGLNESTLKIQTNRWRKAAK